MASTVHTKFAQAAHCTDIRSKSRIFNSEWCKGKVYGGGGRDSNLVIVRTETILYLKVVSSEMDRAEIGIN